MSTLTISLKLAKRWASSNHQDDNSVNEKTSPARVKPVSFGGEGPNLLMLHGFGADRLSWIGTAPALKTLVQCWVFDLPGHGES